MRFLWDRYAPGENSGHPRRKAVPTLTCLEDRRLLSQISYLASVPGLILSSTTYTATPNYSLASGGLAPVTVSGQFVAENPSIKRRDYTVVGTKGRHHNVPAADDGDVVRVLPQKVYADFRAVGPDLQVQPSGPVSLTQVPYSTPNDPLYAKNKAKYVYQFQFVTYLPYATFQDDHPVSVGLQYSITVQAQSRDSGYFNTIQVNLLHNPHSSLPSG